MLIIICRIAQSAAIAFQLIVSCITTRQRVYQPSSVSISGLKSVSCWVSSSSKPSVQGRAIGEYVYPPCTLMIWDGWTQEVVPDGVGGVLGSGEVGSGVCSLPRSGDGAAVPMRLLRVSGYFALTFGQGRQQAISLWPSIAGCLCITAFTFICPGNSTPRCYCSRTLACCFLMRYILSSIAACKTACLCHFCGIQHLAHVGLFQLYPTSLPYHSCRHVENLQDISCCFEQRNSAVTSTIYRSIASFKVIKACFVHSLGGFSANSSAKAPELTTSWCLISRTVRRNAIVDHGSVLLRAAIITLRSFLRTPAVRCTVNWPLCASIWIYPHPTACCFPMLLLPVWWMIFKCAFWVICVVSALAASRWTHLCLQSCCLPKISVFSVVLANRPVFNPLLTGGGGCLSMPCWCGIW